MKNIFTTNPHAAQRLIMLDRANNVGNSIFSLTGTDSEESVRMTGEELDSLALQWMTYRTTPAAQARGSKVALTFTEAETVEMAERIRSMAPDSITAKLDKMTDAEIVGMYGAQLREDIKRLVSGARFVKVPTTVWEYAEMGFYAAQEERSK